VFSKRLFQFIEYQRLNASAFERECLVTHGVVSKSIQNKTVLSGTNLIKIAKRYPEFNIDWLLTGDGKMLKNENEKLETKLKSANNEVAYWKDLVDTLKLTVKEKYSVKNKKDVNENDIVNEVEIELQKGILKVIQSNPVLFNVSTNKKYSEIEAIRLVASHVCNGDKVQIENFEIRQSYIAICNLISLGFRESAIEQATELISRAEWFQQYKIAQDLCDKLITHHYQYGIMESVTKYKTLYDRFALILSCEHESKLLYGQAIYNYKHIVPIDVKTIMGLLEAIKSKLPVDSLWYHYYYYQCKTLMYTGKDLENLYVEAIDYFENLYFNHTNFISYFTDCLIRHYLENNKLEKALLLVQKQTELFEPGTIRWFRNSLSYVNILLKTNNPKSEEVCKTVIDHPKFKELPDDRKVEWEIARKASINVRKNSK